MQANMSDRVACSACGKWMFALAKTCPHCGASKEGAVAALIVAEIPRAPAKKIELSSEEARSLLAMAVPNAEPRMKDVAGELVLPRGGMVDLVLSLIALPLTTLTLIVLGYGVLQTMRKRLPVNLRGARLLAVPTAAALAAVLLFQNDASDGVWAALGLCLGAWIARDLIRAQRRKDPFD